MFCMKQWPNNDLGFLRIKSDDPDNLLCCRQKLALVAGQEAIIVSMTKVWFQSKCCYSWIKSFEFFHPPLSGSFSGGLYLGFECVGLSVASSKALIRRCSLMKYGTSIRFSFEMADLNISIKIPRKTPIKLMPNRVMSFQHVLL